MLCDPGYILVDGFPAPPQSRLSPSSDSKFQQMRIHFSDLMLKSHKRSLQNGRPSRSSATSAGRRCYPFGLERFLKNGCASTHPRGLYERVLGSRGRLGLLRDVGDRVKTKKGSRRRLGYFSVRNRRWIGMRC